MPVLTAAALVLGGMLVPAQAAMADPSGLILQYDLTQSSGTAVVDASGNSNTGTLQGSGTWSGANGLALDGTSAYVQLPNNIMSGLSAITISTEVLVSSSQSVAYFIWGLGNPATSGSGTGYLFASGDALRAGITTGNWSGEKVTSKGSNIARGVWKTVTYTQTGTTGTLYEDGAQVAQNTGVTVLPSAVGGGTTTQDFLGKSDYATDNLLKGNVKDFRIYNRALSATEVAGLAITDQQRIDNDAAGLSLGNTSAQVSNLTLPSTGSWGSSISWASSNPAVVSNSGVVTQGDNDQSAVLTATITSGSSAETEKFTISVPAQLPAAQRAQAAADAIVVHGIDDVRGYLTLPQTGEYNSTISWASSDGSTISDTGVVQRPAHGAPTATVQLTATATVGAATGTHVFTATVPALPPDDPKTGYMFAYFTGNTTAGENIYFAASHGNNALSWGALNGGSPALTSTMDTKGLRDPFIMRSADGDKFYVLATDLSIGSGTSWGDASSKGSLYLEVYESDDLVHWSAQRHIYVGPAGAGDAWAPEASWAPSLGEYVIYWAANTTLNGNTYHRTYISTTRDFYTVSPPQLWDDPGSSVIDTDVLHANGSFYRFTKDEGHVTGCADILQEKNSDLLAVRDDPEPGKATSTPWVTQDSCIGSKAGTSAVEGPTAFQANPGDTSGYKYYLFVDEYGGRGYIPLGTNDLDHPNWAVPATYSLPPDPRHGTVMPITAAEMNALTSAPVPLPANSDGEIIDYPMTQSTGTTVTDASGGGNNGTVVGGGTWTGSSLSLDGQSDYVKLPNNVTAGLSAITVSSDVYINSSQAKPYFIWGLGNTDSSGTGNGYLFTSGDNYRASLASGNWTTEQTVSTSSALGRGSWNTLTYTLAGGTATLYLNGVQVATKTGLTLTPGDIGFGSTTANYIGKSLYNSDNLLSGQIKNFRIYNQALSPSDVAALAGGTEVAGSTSSQLKSPAVVTLASHLVVLPVQPGVDLASFDPKLIIPTGSTLSESGPQDYTSPRTVTVTAPDGSSQQWTIAAHTLTSPLVPGLFADSNIARFGDTYYMYGTTDGFAGWGSTTFKVYTSKDMVNWTDRGQILDLATVAWGHTNAWAPTIAYKNGTYYFYFCDGQSVGVATSSSPLGPFVDKGTPLVAKGAYTGQMIDPDVFVDDDGRAYMYWGNGHGYVVPLNADMESFDASKVQDLTSQLSNFTEGSFMVKRNGVYYLSYSNGDTGNASYNVQYATGTSPMGPFTSKGVILSQDPTQGIYATGHESMIQVPGTDDWYMAYHRFAIPGGDGTHRETTIDRMYFNSDGTIKPVVPTLEGVAALQFNGTAPIASVSNTGANGWSSAGAALTISSGQNTSSTRYRIDGGAWTSWTAPVTLPSGQHTIDYQAQGTDLIWGAIQTLTVKVDVTAPAVTTATNPPEPSGSNGWFDGNGDVTLALTATDDLSGVAKIEYAVNDGGWQTYTAPIDLADGTSTVSYRATDQAGNTSVLATTIVKRDAAAPVTSAVLDPALPSGVGGWWNAPMTLTLSATDVGGSGVVSTQYAVGDGVWKAYTGPVTIDADGDQNVQYRSTDVAGNVEATKSVQVKVDTTAPLVAANLDGTDPLTVSLVSSDATSGVGSVSYQIGSGAWTPYSAPFKVTKTSAAQTVSFRATDNAGNTSAVRSVTVAAKPVVLRTSVTTLSVSPTSLSYGGTVSATVSVTSVGSIGAELVTLYDRSALVGAGVLKSGQAVIKLTDLTVGRHVLTAKFAGNATVGESTSSARAVAVVKTKSATSVKVSTIGQSYGTAKPVTVTASVITDNKLAAAGQVRFRDGSKVLSTVPVVDGKATLRLSQTLAVGKHTITGEFLPSDPVTALGSISTATTITVNKAVSTTTLKANRTSQKVGKTIVFTAAVGLDTNNQVAGTVTFVVDGKTAASLRVSNGAATYTLPGSTKVGKHTVKARFAPLATGTVAASTSGSLTITIAK